MTLGEAIEVCKEMQKWRRSEPPYDGGTPKTYKGMPFTTEEFGLAVDQLIELEETLDELQERVNKAEARNKEILSQLQDKYDTESKQDGYRVTCMVSRRHTPQERYERHQGYLSGLLVAIGIANKAMEE